MCNFTLTKFSAICFAFCLTQCRSHALLTLVRMVESVSLYREEVTFVHVLLRGQERIVKHVSTGSNGNITKTTFLAVSHDNGCGALFPVYTFFNQKGTQFLYSLILLTL